MTTWNSEVWKKKKTNMKFNQDVYLRLFKLVETRRSLYDQGVLGHKDTDLAKQLWMEIAEEMGEEGLDWSDWKKVWKNKRDFFCKKRRELLSCQSAYKRKKILCTPFYKELQFLIPHITGQVLLLPADQEGEDNLDSTDVEEVNQSDNNVRNIKTEGVPDMDNVMSADNWTLLSNNHIGSLHPAAGSYSDPNGSVGQFMHAAPTSSSSATAGGQKRSASQMTEDDDDNMSIFNYLSKKIKTFSKSTQEWVEDELLRIFVEAKKRERNLQQQQQQQDNQASSSSCSGPAVVTPVHLYQTSSCSNCRGNTPASSTPQVTAELQSDRSKQQLLDSSEHQDCANNNNNTFETLPEVSFNV